MYPNPHSQEMAGCGLKPRSSKGPSCRCVCPGLVWAASHGRCSLCQLFYPGATEWSWAALAQACELHKAGEGVSCWQELGAVIEGSSWGHWL